MTGEEITICVMPKSKQKEITDDEFLNECIKSNEICSHVTCKKSIKLINIKCVFCSKLFCTTHILSEVHGCGGAARKSASAAQKKTPNQEKMQELEKKMSHKLEKMKNDRKKKGNGFINF